MNLCILIPSYNEEKTIAAVVKGAKGMGFDVIVVDDGSSDNTEKAAMNAGAIVIRHRENIGKGASVNDGFDFIKNKTSFDGLIMMDGDGQHDSKDIPKFVSSAEKDGGDIIIGNRMNFARSMPFVRRVTNKFMSSVLSAMCGQHIPDTQCGFRLVRRNVIEGLNLESKKYDFESEMLIKAARKNFKITSVPIEAIYRNESSSINPLKDTFRFSVLLVKEFFNKRG